MIYKEPSEDIIGNILSSLTFPVTIKSVTDNGNGTQTIKACDMYHAQPGFPLTIGGKTYKITDIVASTRASCGGSHTLDQLVVKGVDPIVVSSFSMYPPFYFHMTPLAMATEMLQKNKELEKVPMGWLYEQFTDGFNEDPMSNVERTIDFRLFFLTHAEHESWLTAEAYKKAIKPMRRLAEMFVDKIKSQAWRFDVDTMTYDIKNYAKFGVFLQNKGMEKQVWHDKVGGCELSMSLTVFKSEGCESCES